MITTNHIYKDLISIIQTVLSENKLNWQIIQSYQLSMGNFKPPFIMLHRLTATNYGWQFGKDYTEEEERTKIHKHTENQIEIIKFQIEAYRPRQQKDNVNTISATDVVRLIARYFMSEAGIQAVREKGYEVFRITEVVEEYYKEVNDVYQVAPHFKLELRTVQTDTTPTDTIKDFAGVLKRV